VVQDETYRSYDAPKALAAIEKEKDPETLARYLDLERESKNRKSVLEALENRLEAVKNEAVADAPDPQEALKPPEVPEVAPEPESQAQLEEAQEEVQASTDQSVEPDYTGIDDQYSEDAENIPDQREVWRPEVLHSENSPPLDAIRENKETMAEDAKNQPEVEDPTVEIPQSVLQERILDDDPGARFVTAASVEELIDQLEEEQEDKEEGIRNAQEEAESVETLQEAAELHHNYPDHLGDPVQPPLVQSSGPDDFAQRFDASEDAAAPLRAEAAASVAERDDLNSSQHQVAALKADEGEQWPPDPESPESLAEKNAADTEEAEEYLADEARKLVSKLREAPENQRTVAHMRSDTPDRPDQSIRDDQEIGPFLVPFNGPNPPLAIGDAVSRMDEAHGEIGVVISRQSPPGSSYNLLEVEFPDSGTAYLDASNLRYEGAAKDLVAAAD